MTTLDLLITLGDKLADVLIVLLNKKMIKEERQQTEALLQQYSQVKETHTQLQALVMHYNQAVERMLAMGGPQEVFPLCTAKEYQAVQHEFNQLTLNQIVYQRLDQLEVSSVGLTTETVEDLKPHSFKRARYQHADAYTREVWTTGYQTGQYLSQDVVNHYVFVQVDGGWKVDGVEVFTRVPRNGKT